MNYSKFKKILESKDIVLFDHEYRISYYEITNYLKNKSKEMQGGGKNKISDIPRDKLLMMVKISISSNPLYLYND
jgi:hypothetical protein